MKERKATRRIVVFALALVTTLVSAQAAAASECADYISGWHEGGPFSGQIMGMKHVELTFGADGLGLVGTISESFYVATYRADNGTTVSVRCDNYTLWLL